MKQLRIFIGCLCLLLAGCGRQKEAGSEQGGREQAPPTFQFAAHAGSSVVRLMWIPPSWPKDADGLVVKRRVAGSKKWEPRCAPISPGLRADRVWEGHAFSQERVKDLREQVQLAVRKKPLPANPASFIAMLWQQGVGISVHPPFNDQDYDTALLAGLAWEDGEFDREKIYEYGVFWSIAGTIAKAPAAVRRVKYCDGIDGFKLAAEPGNGEALKLVWKFDREKADYFGIVGFRLQCNSPSGDAVPLEAKLVPLHDDGSYEVEVRPGFLAGATTFTVAAVRGLGGDHYVAECVYRPKVELPAGVLEIVSLQHQREDIYTLRWKFRRDLDDQIKCFHIFWRPVSPSGAEFRTFMMFLDRHAREYTGRLKGVKPGQEIEISLEADRKPERLAEVRKHFVIAKPEFLDAPVGLKGVCHLDGNQRAVTVSWDYRGRDPEDVTGFLVEKSMRSFPDAESGRVPGRGVQLGRESRAYRVDVPGKSAVDLHFRVRAISAKTGQPGRPAVTSVHVPALELPVVQMAVVERFAPTTAIVHWNYPPVPDLAGFRVYHNDKVTGKGALLPPSTRRAMVNDLRPGLHRFRVEAVSTYNRTSKPCKPLTFELEPPRPPTLEELLRDAVEQGDVAAAKELIARGARVDDVLDGQPLAYRAVLAGHAAMLELLADHGARLPGMNTLFEAVLRGDARAVAKYARRFPLSSRLISQGVTPLLLAAFLGKTECLKVLVSHDGVDLDARDETIFPRGRSAVSLAAAAGHAGAVQLLVEAGADVNLEDELGRRLVDYVADLELPESILREIVKRTRAPIRPAIPSPNGCITVLHRAATLGNRKLVDLLLAAGTSANIRSTDGRTPLMCAVAAGKWDVVRTLLRNGASMTAIDYQGKDVFDFVREDADKEKLRRLQAQVNTERK